MPSGPEPLSRARAVLLGVFFFSGFVALLYEVMWMRSLRLLFGNGAHAAAATLAVFFSGLALGSFVFGRWSARTSRPLRLYIALEIAIAISALLYFLLPPLTVWIHAGLLDTLAPPGPTALAAKLSIAFALLLPPAFLMGGTLPVMGEVFVRQPSELAVTAGRLYATNTAGAALGALVGGFWLPVALGLRASYATAVALNLALAGAAALASRSEPSGTEITARPTAPRAVPGWVALYAFLGGLATLALEVLWTRMFALVLNSSVYAFGAILVVFLAALAVGAFLSARLTSLLPAELHLFLLLLGAGLLVGLSPFALHAATGRLGSIPADWGFVPYMLLVFGTVLAVVLPPAALCGAVLPGLLRHARGDGSRPGETLGTVVAINTAGGVIGALIAGFALLPWLGLWRSVSTLAFLYVGLALFAVAPRAAGGRYLRPAALVAAVLLGTFLDPTQLALVRAGPGEHTLEIWETPGGVVAVTSDARGKRIRLDNVYVLGGTEGREEERLQADLPLALHGAARRVYFLGLGTGITAAAALDHEVDQVTATELLPEVAEASRKHFAQDAGPLFSDARAEVLAVDGRAHLAVRGDSWDVIVSDLFIPWHEGTGCLYTREHFEVVRDHLASGGLFAQWLPLFQLSRSDFDTIARTMLEVFDDVTLWYAELRPDEPVAALVARRDGKGHRPLTRALPAPARFGGDLSAARSLFAEAPLNTDDHPVLEHRAPLSQAAVRSGRESWLVGPTLDDLLEAVSRSATGHGTARRARKRILVRPARRRLPDRRDGACS